jgi:hypothetical protein
MIQMPERTKPMKSGNTHFQEESLASLLLVPLLILMLFGVSLLIERDNMNLQASVGEKKAGIPAPVLSERPSENLKDIGSAGLQRYEPAPLGDEKSMEARLLIREEGKATIPVEAFNDDMEARKKLRNM